MDLRGCGVLASCGGARSLPHEMKGNILGDIDAVFQLGRVCMSGKEFVDGKFVRKCINCSMLIDEDSLDTRNTLRAQVLNYIGNPMCPD